MSYAKVVKDDWKDVEVILVRNIRGGVRTVALAFERQVKGNIQSLGLIDTGNYIRSWIMDIGGDGLSAEIASDQESPQIEEHPYSRKRRKRVVGSPVVYGPYLEYGTRFMPARPHILPAAETVAANVDRAFDRLDRR